MFAKLDAASLCALEASCATVRRLLLDDELAWKRIYLARCGETHTAEFDGVLRHSLRRLWHHGGDDSPMPPALLWKWLLRARFSRLRTADPPAAYEVGCRVVVRVRGPSPRAWLDADGAPGSECDCVVAMCGAWRDGKLSGPGIVQRAEGASPRVDTYVGDFTEGLPDGDGLADASTGFRFRGEIRSGRFCGSGAVAFPDGTRYVGSFLNGLPHGESGVHIYPNGARYHGDTVAGARHGHGVYEFVSAPPHAPARGSIPLVVPRVPLRTPFPSAASSSPFVRLSRAAGYPAPGSGDPLSRRAPPFTRFAWPSVKEAHPPPPSMPFLRYDGGDADDDGADILRMCERVSAHPPRLPPSKRSYALPPPLLAELLDRYLVLSFSPETGKPTHGSMAETLASRSLALRADQRRAAKARRGMSPHEGARGGSSLALRYEGGWSNGKRDGWAVTFEPGLISWGRFVDGKRQGVFSIQHARSGPSCCTFLDDVAVSHHAFPSWAKRKVQELLSHPLSERLAAFPFRREGW